MKLATNSTPFTFFGSSRFSVIVLDELERLGLTPTAIVTTPDKPQGRKMILTPTPVKEWAIARKIPVYENLADLTSPATTLTTSQLFIVASYGKIIPQAVLDLPTHKTLNIHPSLLPKYRGASPLQSAILDDAKETGVTIMQVDAQMDHGPIVAQEKVPIGKIGGARAGNTIQEWPTYEEFEEIMAKKGAQLLARTLPDWIAGKIVVREQDHTNATFTKKIKKEDGEVEIGGAVDATNLADSYLTFRKIQAFHHWPQAYFFVEHGTKDGAAGATKKIRVKITQASWQNSDAETSTTDGATRLRIEKVIPEGSKEMSYEDFSRGYYSH